VRKREAGRERECLCGFIALHFYPNSQILGENSFVCVCVCIYVWERGRQGERDSVCVDSLHSIFTLCMCVCVHICVRKREGERTCKWIGMHSISIQLIDSWVRIALHVCVCAYMCEKEGGRERESVRTWI